MDQGSKTRQLLLVTSEQGLEERLRFETLLSDLSARFLATPVDQVDSEIDHALKRLLEFFQVDRCSLLEFEKDQAFARITHAAFGEGLKPISGEINLAEAWRAEEDLDFHLRSGEYLNLLLVLEMSIKQPEIRFDTIASSMGIEAIEKARSRAK